MRGLDFLLVLLILLSWRRLESSSSRSSSHSRSRFNALDSDEEELDYEIASWLNEELDVDTFGDRDHDRGGGAGAGEIEYDNDNHIVHTMDYDYDYEERDRGRPDRRDYQHQYQHQHRIRHHHGQSQQHHKRQLHRNHHPHDHILMNQLKSHARKPDNDRRNQLLDLVTRFLNKYLIQLDDDEFEPDNNAQQNHAISNLTLSELIENLRGLRARRRRSSIVNNLKLTSVISNSGDSGNPFALSSRLGPSSGSLVGDLSKRSIGGSGRLGIGGGSSMGRPAKKVAEIDGDIVLGGLHMVHERGDAITCGPIMPQGGIQALETMLYTVDKIEEMRLLPGIRLGVHILDDCDKDTYGLEQAVDFIKGSISNIDDENELGTKCANESNAVKNKIITGVVGAASSVTSIQVANLLRLFKIPQISFFSTSPELSNKARFEFFKRTIPSDSYQVQVMVDIIEQFGWKYVSIIYEESNYGIKAFEEFEKILPQRHICIAAKEKLVKDSGVAGDNSYDRIVDRLQAYPKAKGVIIFGSDQEVKALMRAVGRRGLTNTWSFIGSDGWSSRTLVSDGNERTVEGTLSVQPRANPVKGFDEYFFNLNVKTNTRNPWFVEFWEHHFQCRYPNSSRTQYNLNFTKHCSGEEKLTAKNTQFEAQLQFVSDAVLAFAYAFRDMHRVKCHGIPGLCPEMNPIDGTELLDYLTNVSFTGFSGDEFHFDQFGDGPARYNIIHFRRIGDNYRWVRVGSYNEGNLTLNMSQVQFADNTSIPQPSVCSEQCDRGSAKKISDVPCCWNCQKCLNYEIRDKFDESQCTTCALGTLPNSLHTECIPLPEIYLRPSSGWAMASMTFAGLGILLTLFVLTVFMCHNDTPVVRASGRELSYVLLIGLLLCYALTFLFVFRPNDIICGVQQFGTGFCFTLVYAALLTKTNRIARIFKAGKQSARRPSFISPRSQLVICAMLLSIQVIINVVWMLLQPPKAIHFYPVREINLLVCSTHLNAAYTIAFAYPILLIVVCTVYAVLTRKIPEAFNESKHIGFTMYTTCIIWIAFATIYFASSNQVALRFTSMTISISLSATVMIVCLFSPKLYIILFHPERNVRQSMMPNANRQSAMGTNATGFHGPPGGGGSSGQTTGGVPTTIPLHVLNQNHVGFVEPVKKIDSGTQYDEDGALEIKSHDHAEEKVRQVHREQVQASAEGAADIEKHHIWTQTESSNVNSSNCTDTSPELELNGLTDLSVNTPNSNCSTNYSKSQYSPNDLVNPTTFIIGGGSGSGGTGTGGPESVNAGEVPTSPSATSDIQIAPDGSVLI